MLKRIFAAVGAFFSDETVTCPECKGRGAVIRNLPVQVFRQHAVTGIGIRMSEFVPVRSACPLCEGGKFVRPSVLKGI